MTLTIKEPSPLSLSKPGSTAGSLENNSDRTTRSNPVCLEVGVTIRSLPGEKGESSGSAQPTREETRTVIVFDNGAVLRLSGNFPPGQAVILTNSQGREVVCRVVSARNLPNVKGYIEVEFQEPIIDFWGIHRPAEPVNVSKLCAPVVTQPQAVTPAQIVPSELPPPLLSAPAHVAPSVPVKDIPATVITPSFQDIAALDRMPAPSPRGKAPEPPSRMPASRIPDQSKQETLEAARSYSTSNTAGPASDLTSLSGSWDGTPSPSRKLSSSNDILGKFSESVDTVSGASSSRSQGKTPLIIAGAAVVFIGLGTGLFFMRREPPATQSPVPVATATQSIAPKRPVLASDPAPSASALPSLDQPSSRSTLPPESEPPKESVATSASLSQTTRHPAVDADVVEPERPTQRPQSAQNLKMKAPSIERGSGRLVDSSVPSIDDVAAIGGVNGTPGVGLISTVSHANNPPPPPVAFAGSSSSGKTANQPKMISSTRPVYPALAKQANIEGDVVVSAEIDAAGNVIQAKAIGGPMFLQQAAADAVRQWKYEPATLDGRPTSAHITVKIQFRLK